MKRVYYILGLAALILLSLTVLMVQPAQAQEQPAPENQGEATSGAARIGLIHGDVSVMRGDSGEWVAATVNTPVVRGDKVTTGQKSQTEIQLDHANVLRLAPTTEVKVADLTRTRIQIQVAQGLANYDVLKGNEADAEIDTSNMAVHPLKEGAYRIEVLSPTETRLIVRSGQAEVSTPDGNTRVESGNVINVRGSDHPEYQIAEAPARDDWDKWNKDRDNTIDRAQNYQHVDRYYTGAQDLDRHGHWVYVPDYDWCWTPYVDAGWVPYRYGSWLWEPYWGWTWVSYEPWGWAPYHYGRWFYWGNSWCWWPGYRGYGYRPIWGPAYVSFLGFGFGGRNWGFGFGYGYNSIGWCPLGPRDTFHPWWGGHNSYNAVNITNITNVSNFGGRAMGGMRRQPFGSNLQAAMTNANVRNAISHVPANDFGRGPVPRQQQPLSAASLRGGQLVQGTLPAVPTRDSLRPTNRPVNTASLPRNANAPQNFFTRHQPPATGRSFNQQAAGIQQMVQRENPMQAAGRGTAAGGASPLTANGAAARPGMGNASRPTLSDAQNALRNRGGEAANTRFAPQAQSASPATARGNAPAAVQGRGQSGWQRFGQPAATAGRGNGAAPAGNQGFAQRSNAAPAIGGRPLAQPAPRTQAAPPRSTSSGSQPGWQRFGAGQPRAVPNSAAPATAAPHRAAAPSGFRTMQARPAPSGTGGAQGGFQTFTRQPQSASRAEPRAAAPGWSRFSRSEAPSSGSRPPLEIRRPITTGRTAPSSGGRGWERSAPSSSPRNFQGGQSRGNSGGAYSAPPRSFGGSSSSGWGGGGSRSYSYSAPRSSGGGWGSGGGRSPSYSAPRSSGGSGGGGGGGRSYSGGGGHSSGGGGSHGGGHSGRR